MAREHLREGRFEDAEACLRLIEQHATLGRERLGGLMGGPLRVAPNPEGSSGGRPLPPPTVPAPFDKEREGGD